MTDRPPITAPYQPPPQSPKGRPMKPRIDRPASDTFTLSIDGRVSPAGTPLSAAVWPATMPHPVNEDLMGASHRHPRGAPEIPHAEPNASALAHVRGLEPHQQWELGRAASRAGVPFQVEMPSDWRNGWWASDMLPHRPQRGEAETCGLWEAVLCTQAEEPSAPHPDTIRVSTATDFPAKGFPGAVYPDQKIAELVADNARMREIIDANDRMASALREIRDACAATTTRAYTTLSTIDGIARRGLL